MTALLLFFIGIFLVVLSTMAFLGNTAVMFIKKGGQVNFLGFALMMALGSTLIYSSFLLDTLK